MQQHSLLGRTPAARNTDPETSHLAEQHINETGIRERQQRAAYAVVCNHPGHTSAELAKYCDLDSYQLARRLPELRPVHVRTGSKRKCTVTGRWAQTWHKAK